MVSPCLKLEAVVERHVLQGVAGEHVERRVEAQALLHRGFGLLGVGEERRGVEAAFDDGLHARCRWCGRWPRGRR